MSDSLQESKHRYLVMNIPPTIVPVEEFLSLDVPPTTNSHNTSGPNKSFEECLDLSMNNFWLLLYLPCGDQDFEIVHGRALERDCWAGLARGSEVILTKGGAKVHGYIVTFSKDRSHLNEYFADYTQKFREELAANILNVMRSKTKSQHIRDVNATPSTIDYLDENIIEVADKETQTYFGEDIRLNSDGEIHRRNIELEIENKRLLRLFREISENLTGTMTILHGVGVSPDKNEKVSSPGRQQAMWNCENETECLNENIIVENGKVSIGPGGTKISATLFNKINWGSYTSATRRLLMALFSREILATHSLTGKPSPAFMESSKETKKKLDSTIISDIIDVVSRKSGVTESMVRAAITTKCADENKMFKKKMRTPSDDILADVLVIKRSRI